MASESSSADPSPGHAQDALDALDRDRSRLADQISTPHWYHPTLAALTAVAAIAPALPEPWSLTTIAVFVILLGAVPTLARRGGVALSARPTGRATGLILGLQVMTLIAFMATSAMVRVFELGWWPIAPIAVAVFVIALLLGRHFDRAQHAELSRREQSP